MVKWSSIVGRGGQVVECWTFGQGDQGFKTTCGRASDFLVKGTGIQNHLRRFKAWATSFTPLCLYLLEETVKAVGLFYLVPQPGEVKDPTQGNGKYLLWTH